MSAQEQVQHTVVANDELQYSIWRSDQALPPGWHSMGVSGSREDCLAHISVAWTDMRPLSLRRAMEEAGHGDRD